MSIKSNYKLNSKIMEIYNELLKKLKGSINGDTLNMKYHKPLPAELAKWYIYTLADGHNIFVFLKQFDVKFMNDNHSYINYLIPCSVKTVLRGYTLNKDGIIVVEGLEFTPEIGLNIPTDDFEYSTEVGKNNELTMEFSKKEIVKTNYFYTSANRYGLCWLVYNRYCFHLLIPSAHRDKIKEMKESKYVVITTGFNKLLGVEMVELLFEDFTSTPFSISISLEVFNMRITALNKFKFKLIAYSIRGKVIEMDAYVRSDVVYSLPYLQPINKKLFTACPIP